jgi:hypothetical protein
MSVTKHVCWTTVGGLTTRYSVLEYASDREQSEEEEEKLTFVLIPGTC